MKSHIFCILFLFFAVCLFSFEVREIPLEAIQDIAIRNAKAIWGEVSSDEPIPVYDKNDRLIAWQFNYALNKPFPRRKDLMDRLKVDGNDLYGVEWIGDEFGNIIAGARTDQPPIIAYGNGLSEHYDSFFKMDELACSRFSKDYVLEREVFISMGSEWFVVSYGDEIRYIKASPPFLVCTRDEFLEKANHPDYPEKEVDYSAEWQTYLEGQVLDRNYVFIEDNHLMPFISYSYGCTPTSGAMLNEYYKNRSPYVEGHFTKLVQKFSRRHDLVSDRTRFHVSDAHTDIADFMLTESTHTGATLPWLVSMGMGDYYDSRGHNYWGGVYSWHWNYFFSNADMFDDLKHEINYNYPALMNTYNHTICAMGYNNSTNMVAAHDPNSYRITYWNISNFFFLTKVHPRPRSVGAHINLLAPDGGQDWAGNGTNPILRQNSVFEIRWEGDLLPNTFVDIHYGTNAENPIQGMVPIVQNHPNTGYYPWLIPANLESESVRILIRVKNSLGEHLGYDCSWGEFTVTTGGSVFKWVMGRSILSILSFSMHASILPTIHQPGE